MVFLHSPDWTHKVFINRECRRFGFSCIDPGRCLRRIFKCIGDVFFRGLDVIGWTLLIVDIYPFV